MGLVTLRKHAPQADVVIETSHGQQKLLLAARTTTGMT
jgi:hypothetical protein